jgi:hypothetical protein
VTRSLTQSIGLITPVIVMSSYDLLFNNIIFKSRKRSDRERRPRETIVITCNDCGQKMDNIIYVSGPGYIKHCSATCFLQSQ